VFSNVKAQYGGAIYLFENSNNRQEDDTEGKYKVVGNTFKYCSAANGGAIYLDNAQWVTIVDNTFTNNTALSDNSTNPEISGEGGSIFYFCDMSAQNCTVTFENTNTFEYGYADVRGGAINWEVMEPLIEGDMVFTNNTAIRYGDNIACYASGLIQLTEAEYYYHLYRIGVYEYGEDEAIPDIETMPYFSELLLVPDEVAEEDSDTDGRRRLTSKTFRRTLEAEEGLDEIQSGGVVPTFYLAHVDKYN
jgi:hypothetical protein